ncbi:MAG TPA: asparagine synthase (glutamine-hydrolyzing) [Terriglobales bacterium]|nr:asparagine synthase (glutamine-hydrolyzing) [Terriglobales bacterium]
MCGIFGIIAKKGRVPDGVLENATRTLAHRGPDDCGTALIEKGPAGSGQVGLAHTRLSIIDLSPQGHQPMQDAITGNWIVFNGEIYNFRELRAELEAGGNRFHSHSDTEVILAAYRMWGEDSFVRLRGMFALALWDASRQTLLLARDPMGIKPLYCYNSDKYFLFSSEVRTLVGSGLVPRTIDPNGIFSFLAFGSVYEPRTIVDGVRAIAPGHVAAVTCEKIAVRQYWNLLRNTRGPGEVSTSHNGDDRAGSAISSLLREAVLSHLVSDVPVGVFLSGGIDSSALVALTSRSGVRPATFSLVFREAEFNEAQFSRIVARRFGSEHHELLISQQDALAVIPDALQAMDQPTIDGINTFIISEQARRVGVKVALTGLGADEMFAGYSSFRDVPRLERLTAGFSRLPSAVRRPVAASLEAMSGRSDRSRKISQFANRLATKPANPPHPYFLTRNLFAALERGALYAGDHEQAERELADSLQTSIDASSGLDPVNRVSYLELHWYMRNTLLRDSDFMSMAHGLELRVPFLDRGLVESCLRVPGKEKLKSGIPKPLLLKNLGVELPNEIVHRPKRGFTLPFEHWLLAELRPMVQDALAKKSDSQTFLNGRAVSAVWNRFLAGETSWSRPWSLFVLNAWCERNL